MTGLEFERAVLSALSSYGYWAYRCNPDKHGSQPFDIIACKDSHFCAYDCKVISTSSARFDFRRIEPNQRTAFELLMKRATPMQCGFLVWHNNVIYYVPYSMTIKGNSVRLGDDLIWEPS